MDPTVVVIGQQTCESSKGPIAIGEYVRLPLIEALELQTASKVTLADFQEQQLPEPVSTLPKRRYHRRDLRAEH